MSWKAVTLAEVDWDTPDYDRWRRDGVGSAATDEVHDLQDVVCLEQNAFMLGSRHDLAVAFYGDGAFLQTQPNNQVAHAQGLLDRHAFTVHRNFHDAGSSLSGPPLSIGDAHLVRIAP